MIPTLKLVALIAMARAVNSRSDQNTQKVARTKFIEAITADISLFGYTNYWPSEEGWFVAPSVAGTGNYGYVNYPNVGSISACAAMCQDIDAPGGSYGHDMNPNVCFCDLVTECLEPLIIDKGAIVFSKDSKPEICEKSYCDYFPDEVAFCNYPGLEFRTASPSVPSMVPPRAPTSAEPTLSPTKDPTSSPTKEPTPSPTKEPTPSPTKEPTPSPTKNPTPSPSKKPTTSPTKEPTPSPTKKPTPSPSKAPVTEEPTPFPTKTPTKSPTYLPTSSFSPTNQPIDSTSKPIASTPSPSPNVTTDFPSIQTQPSIVNSGTVDISAFLMDIVVSLPDDSQTLDFSSEEDEELAQKTKSYLSEWYQGKLVNMTGQDIEMTVNFNMITPTRRNRYLRTSLASSSLPSFERRLKKIVLNRVFSDVVISYNVSATLTGEDQVESWDLPPNDDLNALLLSAFSTSAKDDFLDLLHGKTQRRLQEGPALANVTTVKVSLLTQIRGVEDGEGADGGFFSPTYGIIIGLALGSFIIGVVTGRIFISARRRKNDESMTTEAEEAMKENDDAGVETFDTVESEHVINDDSTAESSNMSRVDIANGENEMYNDDPLGNREEFANEPNNEGSTEELDFSRISGLDVVFGDDIIMSGESLGQPDQVAKSNTLTSDISDDEQFAVFDTVGDMVPGEGSEADKECEDESDEQGAPEGEKREFDIQDDLHVPITPDGSLQSSVDGTATLAKVEAPSDEEDCHSALFEEEDKENTDTSNDGGIEKGGFPSKSVLKDTNQIEESGNGSVMKEHEEGYMNTSSPQFIFDSEQFDDVGGVNLYSSRKWQDESDKDDERYESSGESSSQISDIDHQGSWNGVISGATIAIAKNDNESVNEEGGPMQAAWDEVNPSVISSIQREKDNKLSGEGSENISESCVYSI